ncbi:MAG: NERD domain-containing protein [Myxococcaceae bacterium]|jgi:hypothetical protein|nr:NERD domain-containing protein [Myxococcaceae bacterium]MCA3015968.1 NERD domain-containing protein [Myxococcaceae bacterium]
MRLFPHDAPRPTSSKAEAAVYAALARTALPGWTAWHSLRLRTPSGWEGEGDFVVAGPGGLLVLEVKGGQLELRGGRWLQNGRALATPPRDQAQGFVRRLTEAMKRRGAEVPPFGVACCFPDCEFTEGPTSADLEGLVLGGRDLAHLAQALPSVLAAATGPRAPPRSNRWLEVVHGLWGETWVPRVSLRDRLVAATEARSALDAEQLGTLDAAEDNPRALVTGGAGTGKTLLATELCRRRARAGQRVRYLSFTDALATAVEAQFAAESPSPGRPRASSIRQYALDLVAQAGLLPLSRTSEFWRQVSLQAACDALPPEPERPDVIVIDEGQDFEESDWQLVAELIGPRGLWAFVDRAQAFWTARTGELPMGLFAGAAQLKLKRQYRCPAPLWDFAARYGREGPEAPAGQTLDDVALPGSEHLRVVEAAADKVVERVRHELDELRRLGAQPKDVAVVSLSGQTKSALFALDRVGSHRLVRADAPDAGQHVVMETFLRFKGLERPFVVVAELRGPHVTHYGVRMHIALSRATAQAIVVADAGALAADPLLRRATTR